MIKVKRSSFRMIVESDECPDMSYLEQDYKDVADPIEREKYLKRDREKLETYGETWNFISIRAAVNVQIPVDDCFYIHTFTTPGIYGIESDSDKDFIQEAFEEECLILIDILKALNIEVEE